MRKLFAVIGIALCFISTGFASSVVWQETALGNWSDLTTPSSTQKYPLGAIVAVYNDSDKAMSRYEYVKSHAALVQYTPYVIAYSTTANVVTAAVGTMGAPGSQVCVPQVAFTSGYYGFVLIEGKGKALTCTETYANGDFMQVVTSSPTAVVVDGTSGSTTMSVNSCAIILESGTTATSKNIYMFGKRAIVAAN